MILALAAHANLHLQQMDVKMTYLNGVIEEDIFMSQPKGYIENGSEHLVCKTEQRTIWFEAEWKKMEPAFRSILTKIGFKKSNADPILSIMKKESSYLWLLVYVDDLLMASNSHQLMGSVKEQLSGEFDMTDLGDPLYLLGVQIARDKLSGTLTLNQGKYVDDILK